MNKCRSPYCTDGKCETCRHIKASEVEAIAMASPGRYDTHNEIWIWSEAEIEALRAAFAARLGDTSRTEPLMMVAALGARIFENRKTRLTP